MQGTNSRDSPGLPRRRTPHSPSSDSIVALRMNDDYLVWFRRIGRGGKGYHASRTIIAVVHDISSYLLLHSVAIWSGRLVIEADGGVLAGEKATACTQLNHVNIISPNPHRSSKKKTKGIQRLGNCRRRRRQGCAVTSSPSQPHERNKTTVTNISRACLCRSVTISFFHPKTKKKSRSTSNSAIDPYGFPAGGGGWMG
jgi:hypothetical protein